MVRAFLALGLSPEIRHHLSMAQETIRACKARCTFVDPENIHITIKFLGNVEPAQLKDVANKVRSVTFSPFQITTGTITVNNPKRPNTVWCTIDDAGEGERLLYRIEDALSPLGFEHETRRFSPHATIARVKTPDPSLFSALNSLKDKSYGSCAVEGIRLVKSTLLPIGPVYEDLLEVKW